MIEISVKLKLNWRTKPQLLKEKENGENKDFGVPVSANIVVACAKYCVKRESFQ